MLKPLEGFLHHGVSGEIIISLSARHTEDRFGRTKVEVPFWINFRRLLSHWSDDLFALALLKRGEDKAKIGRVRSLHGDRPQPRIRWLFLDLNSYFASVEQELRPELRDRPIAVVPVMADTTCAIAASYEAKAFGVRTGTQVGEAKRLCPGIELVEARHEIYVEYHHQIIEAVEFCVPVSAVLSIDEMAASLIGREQPLMAALDLAQRVKSLDPRTCGIDAALLGRSCAQPLPGQDRLGHGEAGRPGGADSRHSGSGAQRPDTARPARRWGAHGAAVLTTAASAPCRNCWL